ncbi:maltose/maltodextrin ABC transporter substrate-binding protein MalE [Chitinimonas sp. BJYL2]|uniref:maltose/maltodextrin ABC transporter substrate-binding protein MalE n=1 Tax=Chitinimonas sp. BJYL2 TaxID=2976696 RepID=UPI0022B52B89|nr:maltose/maltodextrin ABC transporter substrate-binding protein MalE [Chitinimonas sp. BJYL2]
MSRAINARLRRHLILAAALTSLSSTGLAADKLKLLVWINGDKGYNGLQKAGDKFTEASGVKVVVEHPVDAPDKFQQAAGAGKGPDIFCWAHDRVGEWAKAGLIVPLRPGKTVRDAIEDSAWKAFSYQGKTWGYPIAIEAIGLIYNKALVKTPPKTFDEVIKLDRELAVQGKKAILWDYNKSFFTWPMLAGAGGQIFGRDAKGELDPRQVGVNAPGAVQATELLASMIRDGQMPKGARYAEMEAYFARGDLAMMISGPWAWDNARKVGIDYGVAAIPAVVPGKPSKPLVGVVGCMVTAPSKVKDIAREFLEQHMLKPDSLKLINADVPLGVPANKAFYQELASNPHIRATMENARAGEPIPNIPETGRFWTALDAALEAVTNGLQSPKDALDGAAARMLVK